MHQFVRTAGHHMDGGLNNKKELVNQEKLFLVLAIKVRA